MNNGITIEKHQDGIIVDGILHILSSEEEKDVVSKYFFPDYWEEFIATPSEGDISPSSLFIKHSSYAPLPCGAGFTLFSYCNNAKFAAGYLKFMVLCELVSSTLIDLSEFADISNGNNVSFDIDFFMEEYKTDDSDKKDVCDKIKHILRLCNLVFLAQDEAEAKKHLFYAADKFNEYFSEVCGWDFEFRVYSGIENAKDEILEYLSAEDKETVSEIFSETRWDKSKKAIIVQIIENIVG